MPKYRIEIVEGARWGVEVEAKDEAEARSKAEDLYDQHFDDTSENFGIMEEVEQQDHAIVSCEEV